MRRQFNRITLTVAERMKIRLARPPFDAFDWVLIDVRIIMRPTIAPGDPARSRCQHKKWIFNCSPQPDQPAFVAGPGDARWRIYVEGLRETETLMRRPKLRRAKLPREVIDAFHAQVDTLADAPEP